jgi:hypothetical protein
MPEARASGKCEINLFLATRPKPLTGSMLREHWWGTFPQPQTTACKVAHRHNVGRDKARRLRLMAETNVSSSRHETAATRQVPVQTWQGPDSLAQTRHHLLVCREPPGRLLGIGEPAIDRDLENPATASPQYNPGGRIGLQNQLPRRSRTRLIASHAAIFDLDLHLSHLLCWVECASSLAAGGRIGNKGAISGSENL